MASVELGATPSDDPDTPEAGAPTVTPVTGEPEITVSKSDALHADNDGDGVASPGDVIRYTIAIAKVGDGPASGVLLNDLAPADTARWPAR